MEPDDFADDAIAGTITPPDGTTLTGVDDSVDNTAGDTAGDTADDTADDTPDTAGAPDDATEPTADDNQAEAFSRDEMAPPRVGTKPVELPTPRHAMLLRQAIDDRADTLKALAKKNAEEGYPAEARIQSADAAALTLDLRAQLDRQAEIPLATDKEVQGAIANALRPLVHKYARKPGEKDTTDYEALLLDGLTRRIAKYATAIFDKAYAAGYQAREITPEIVGVKAAVALIPGFAEE